MKWLTTFRGRAMSYGLALLGLAAAGPRVPRGLGTFVRGPLGLGVAALALIVIGDFVEELGRMSRIRLGVAIRLSAVAAVAVAACWVGILAPSDAGAFGWSIFAIGAVLILLLARHDLAVFRDPRHTQDPHLEALERDVLRLRYRGRSITIPIARVVNAKVATITDGRAVLVSVERPQKERDAHDARDEIPWMASAVHGDVLMLNEHQLGMDAELFVVQLVDAIHVSDGYR